MTQTKFNQGWPLLFLILLSGFFASAQIDSVLVSSQFTTEPDPNDSIEDLHVINLTISVYDIASMGGLILEVRETESTTPIALFKYSKTQLEGMSAISGPVISLRAYGHPSIDYTIEALVTTTSGARTPKTISYYEAP